MGGEDSGRLRLLLAAMPLLAGVYEAYEAANPGFDPSTFGLELARRLPLALILAIAVYCLFGIVSAALLRLRGNTGAVLRLSSRSQIQRSGQ